jgi:hypothetical protein
VSAAGAATDLLLRPPRHARVAPTARAAGRATHGDAGEVVEGQHQLCRCGCLHAPRPGRELLAHHHHLRGRGALHQVARAAPRARLWAATRVRWQVVRQQQAWARLHPPNVACLPSSRSRVVTKKRCVARRDFTKLPENTAEMPYTDCVSAVRNKSSNFS